MARKRPSNELAPYGAETIEEKQRRIRQDSNSAFQKELDWFQEWFDQDFRFTLTSRWQLGNGSCEYIRITTSRYYHFAD